jgi:triosephosphate isomerase
MAKKFLIAGNWKMHGLAASLSEVKAIADYAALCRSVDVALCCPSTLIERAARHAPMLTIGGQDCHMAVQGAHTGEVSAAMLADAGARLTILGHSERRSDNGETDAIVKAKAEAARAAGLGVILCVGETETQRDAGQAAAVVLAQLLGSMPDGAGHDWLTIAYEPVWAIGTGRVPAAADVAEMHQLIRAELIALLGEDGDAMRILYGGSMKASNAAELLAIPNVDGGLVGGASLSAEAFCPIIDAAAQLQR